MHRWLKVNLADPGEARGCSRNIIVFNSLINSVGEAMGCSSNSIVINSLINSVGPPLPQLCLRRREADDRCIQRSEFRLGPLDAGIPTRSRI